ncbi:MAG: rhomboid family intramembrane serine protease, partial [Tepidisphaeraceae bacterium]
TNWVHDLPGKIGGLEMILPLRTDVPLRRTPWVNWLLIVVNIVTFIFSVRRPELALTWALDGRDPHLLNYFTYGFLHANVPHLVGNMLFLYIFGNNVNDKMGQLGYLGFYLGGGVFAGAAHVFAESAPVVGASGSVSAVTGAFLVLFPRANITIVYIFIFFGATEIASMWFILLFFALDVFKQFTPVLGGPETVAHLAHIGGTIYGAGACLLMLWLRLMPRDQFDVLALIARWNRRRQYRDMVARGFDPFGNFSAKDGGPPNPAQERIQDLRAEISEAIAHSRLDEAVRLFMELRAIDPAQVLSRTNQMDIANRLYELEQHAAAADAYEGLIRFYPRSDRIEHVQLLLGVLCARYLNRYDKARQYLTQALTRLHDEREIELAKSELARIEQLV